MIESVQNHGEQLIELQRKLEAEDNNAGIKKANSAEKTKKNCSVFKTE